MKNKEKYAKEIVETACNGNHFGMDKRTSDINSCDYITCHNCVFNDSKDCDKTRREWAESEYIEKSVISKRDREFLEYIKEEFKCIARDKNNNLFMYTSMLDTDKKGTGWWGSDYYCLNSKFDVYFPMVKWEDSKPWLIEDLKKLEVVEEYEK